MSSNLKQQWTNKKYEIMDWVDEKIIHPPMSFEAFQQAEEKLFEKLEKHRVRKPISFKAQAMGLRLNAYLALPAIAGLELFSFLSNESQTILTFADIFGAKGNAQSASYVGVAVTAAVFLSACWFNNLRLLSSLWNKEVPEQKWKSMFISSERAQHAIGKWIEQQGKLGSKETTKVLRFVVKREKLIQRLYNTVLKLDPRDEKRTVISDYLNQQRDLKYTISKQGLDQHWEAILQLPLTKRERNQLQAQTPTVETSMTQSKPRRL